MFTSHGFPSKETITQDKSNTRLLKVLYLRQVLLLLISFAEEKEPEWSHISAFYRGSLTFCPQLLRLATVYAC